MTAVVDVPGARIAGAAGEGAVEPSWDRTPDRRPPRATARRFRAFTRSKLPPLLTCAAALLVLLPALQAQTSPGESLPVVEHTLDNGMRFLILRRSAAPTVAFVVQYRVGGVNEAVGTTGMAHLLEHMLFKGTTTVGTRNVEAERELFLRMDALHDSILAIRGRPGPSTDTAALQALRDSIGVLEDSARTFVVANEFDRILARNGARGLNATTGSESTTYFVELPANRVKLWFTLEADRMANPVFREFYAERDVVTEERRARVETSPGGSAYEAHLATAFRVHPYGQPVVGWMSDLESHTRNEVREYYRRFYGPRNAVVAVVGDVDPDSVAAWADAYFSTIPPGEEPEPVLAREPEPRGERRVVVRFDAEPQVRMGWRVPSELHQDAAALNILASLLTGGRTSRLHRRLVQEDRLATFVSAAHEPGVLYPRLFTIDAVPRAPHTTLEVEAAVYEELDRLRREGPDPEELARVRNRIEAGKVRRIGSNMGLALQLAGSQTLYGDWRETFRADQRLAAVTSAHVQGVVERYFQEHRRTVTTLVPRSDDGGTGGPDESGPDGGARHD